MRSLGSTPKRVMWNGQPEGIRAQFAKLMDRKIADRNRVIPCGLASMSEPCQKRPRRPEAWIRDIPMGMNRLVHHRALRGNNLASRQATQFNPEAR